MGDGACRSPGRSREGGAAQHTRSSDAARVLGDRDWPAFAAPRPSTSSGGSGWTGELHLNRAAFDPTSASSSTARPSSREGEALRPLVRRHPPARADAAYPLRRFGGSLITDGEATAAMWKRAPHRTAPLVLPSEGLGPSVTEPVGPGCDCRPGWWTPIT